MKPTLVAFGLALAAHAPLPVAAYPIDCAILLCLAGGFPPSVPCAQAKFEFIRRITPFPIEPPLQIWRCPMRARFGGNATEPALPRLLDAAFRSGSGAAVPLSTVIPVQSTGGADIDISDPAYDFVRSIRVFHIDFSQTRGRDECERRDMTRIGTYGSQGDYRWDLSSASAVPAASAFRMPLDCQNHYAFRSVFMDWRDHAGTYGFEEVRY